MSRIGSREYSIIDQSEYFEHRAAPISALLNVATMGPKKENLEQLAIYASSVNQFVKSHNLVNVESSYVVFSELLEIAHALGQWRLAVRNAEVDADRFLRSARLRLNDLSQGTDLKHWSSTIKSIEAALNESGGPQNLSKIFCEISQVQLPLPLLSLKENLLLSRGPRIEKKPRETSKPSPKPVGIVEFSIAGSALHKVHVVPPDVLHDLEVSLRVSTWPDEFERLILEPITVEPAGTYQLPRFVFQKSGAQSPIEFKADGRMLLKSPQAFGTRPLEFLYSARFENVDSSKPLPLEGRSRFELRCYDPDRDPITGYSEADRRIIQVREELRKYSGLGERQMALFMLALGQLCKAAGKSLQDNEFKDCESEAQFQSKLRGYLRDEPKIGSRLEEHAKASGGFTDLSLDKIRIELKYEDKNPIDISTAKQFFGQACQYVAGSDSRLGILCVMDNSTKSKAPHSLGNDIALEVIPPNNDPFGIPLLLGVVIIRAKLPKPSDLSR